MTALIWGGDIPRTVSVLVPLAVPKAYDYAVPPGLDVPVGAYVTVALRPAGSPRRGLGPRGPGMLRLKS